MSPILRRGAISMSPILRRGAISMSPILRRGAISMSPILKMGAISMSPILRRAAISMFPFWKGQQYPCLPFSKWEQFPCLPFSEVEQYPCLPSSNCFADPVVKVSAFRAADLGSDPAFTLDLFNNNNNCIQRRYSRFFTISSLSPTCTLKRPGCNLVQITCNTSSAYHVQVSRYVPLGTKGQLSYKVWQSWNRICLSFILLTEPLNWQEDQFLSHR